MRRREFLKRVAVAPAAGVILALPAAKPAPQAWEPEKFPVAIRCPWTKKRTIVGWESERSSRVDFFVDWAPALIHGNVWAWREYLRFTATYKSAGEPDINAPRGSVVQVKGWLVDGEPMLVYREISVRQGTPEGLA